MNELCLLILIYADSGNISPQACVVEMACWQFSLPLG